MGQTNIKLSLGVFWYVDKSINYGPKDQEKIRMLHRATGVGEMNSELQPEVKETLIHNKSLRVTGQGQCTCMTSKRGLICSSFRPTPYHKSALSLPKPGLEKEANHSDLIGRQSTKVLQEKVHLENT